MWWEAGKIGKRKAGEIGKIFTHCIAFQRTRSQQKCGNQDFTPFYNTVIGPEKLRSEAMTIFRTNKI